MKELMSLFGEWLEIADDLAIQTMKEHLKGEIDALSNNEEDGWTIQEVYLLNVKKYVEAAKSRRNRKHESLNVLKAAIEAFKLKHNHE
jgi:hypothetical protein